MKVFCTCPCLIYFLKVLQLTFSLHPLLTADNENTTSSFIESGLLFFSQEPESQRVKEGDEVVLHCILENEPPGSHYFWYRYSSHSVTEFKEDLLQVYSKNSSTNLLDGENRALLNLTRISREDRGYYQCKVQTQLYSIYSGAAFVEVDYYDEPEHLVTVEERTVNAYEEELYFSCDTSNTSYNLNIFWTKDGDRISSPRMFVFPENSNVGQSLVIRGSLLIINALQEDSGRYECHTDVEGADFTEEKITSIYQLTVNSRLVEPVEKSLIPVFASFPIGVEGPQTVTVHSGESVTLACAAKGYPSPTYSWEQIPQTGSNIEIKSSTEYHILSDYNRQLVVNMIEEVSQYACFMSNIINGVTREIQKNFYVSVKGRTESSDIDFIQESNSSVIVMKPNQYKPFTLNCRVRKSSTFQLVWLKNGKKIDWIKRDRITELEQTDSEIQGNTFYFHSPNERDLGVYQCVVVSTEGEKVRVKQITNYITLTREHLAVDSESRQPNYLFLPGPFYVDGAEEACRSRKMHLVSILDSKENGLVLDMVRENNVTNVWIGLTREVPKPEGTWRWTMPGDNSFFFSNWDHEKPDNHLGHQEYAIMLNTTGKWQDVRRSTWKRSAVCKNYTVVCPSVDEFYDGRVGVRGWEAADASYYIGQRVEVYCRYPHNTTIKNKKMIKCGSDANFDEPVMDNCLSYDAFFRVVYPSASSCLDYNYLLTMLIWFLGLYIKNILS